MENPKDPKPPETIIELITPPSDDYIDRDHWTYKLGYYVIFFGMLYALKSILKPFFDHLFGVTPD